MYLVELPALVVRVPKTMQGSRQYVVKLSYKVLITKSFLQLLIECLYKMPLYIINFIKIKKEWLFINVLRYKKLMYKT